MKQWMPVLLSLSFVVCAMVSSPVEAQSKQERTIVVMPVSLVSQGQGKTAEYRDAIEDAVHRTQAYAVLGVSEAQSRAVGLGAPLESRSDEKIKKIKGDLAESEEKVFTSPDLALGMVEDVLDRLSQLEGLIGAEKGFEDVLFKAMMVRARSLLDSGKKDGAKAALADVYRVFGASADVTTAYFHPSIVKAYDELLESNVEKGTVRIESSSACARILISGRDSGYKTPSVIEGVMPGELVVRTVSEAGRSLPHVVTIEAGKQARMTIDHQFETAVRLGSSSVGIQLDTESWSADAAFGLAARLGQAVKSDLVLLTGVVSSGDSSSLVGVLVESNPPRLVRAKEISVAKDVVSYRQANELVTALGIVADPGMAEGPAGPWYKNYVGWGLTGAGLIGVVVGGVMGADYMDQKQKIESSVPSATYTLSQVRTDATDAEGTGTGAAVAGGLGGAALVSGIVLFVLDATAGGPPQAVAEQERSRFQFSPVVTEGSATGVQFGFGDSF